MQSRVHSLDDFDVITGPPAPPAIRQKAAEQAPQPSPRAADASRTDQRGPGEQHPIA